MIELFVTPILLALVAGLAGWRTGKAARTPARAVATRLRAAWAALRGRSPLCAECRRTASVAGAVHVLCSKCDPIVLALLDGSTQRRRPRPR